MGRINESLGDKTLLVSFYAIIVILAVICLLPFWLMIVSSFTDEVSFLQNGFLLWPKKFSLDAMRVVFKTNTVLNGYKITIFITFAGTALSMIATCMMSYALSNKKVKYRNIIAFYVYFTMLFSGGLVPSYILITRYLNMKNTLWVYLIPSLISAWNMFLMRNFFLALPDSFAESARIDGASEYGILVKIILPLSLPSITTIGFFYALGNWGSWMPALLYIDKEELWPLQYIIVRMIRSINFVKESIDNQVLANAGFHMPILPSNGVRMATTLVTIGPIIFLYPFIQKYFIKGLTIGGIKG